MRRLLIALFSLVALAGTVAVAQEGHPLKGSWIGTWSGNTVARQRRAAGPELGRQGHHRHDQSRHRQHGDQERDAQSRRWVVHFEADAKDKAGRGVTYVLDGKIENLAMHNRAIIGTWKSQRGSGRCKSAPVARSDERICDEPRHCWGADRGRGERARCWPPTGVPRTMRSRRSSTRPSPSPSTAS